MLRLDGVIDSFFLQALLISTQPHPQSLKRFPEIRDLWEEIDAMKTPDA